MTLTPDYTILENRGLGPVKIESKGNLGRYEIFRKDKPPEYLLVLFPDQVDGEISVKLNDKDSATEGSVLGKYFDQLLRAHRYLLQGRLEEAKSLLKQIESQFDTGYGIAILGANIAVLEGDTKKAADLMEFAKGLQPEVAELQPFEFKKVQ